MKALLVLLSVVVVFLCPRFSQSATISLRTQAFVDCSQQPPVLDIELTNSGDEPAWSVYVETTLGAWSAQTRTVARIDVHETHGERIPIPRPPVLPGIYEVRLKVRYVDVNGHPFSLVALVPLTTGGADVVDRLAGALAPTTVSKSGTVTLTALPFEDSVTNVHVSLVLPDELGCPTPEQRLALSSDDVSSASFTITNYSALAGSVYAIFALLDYQKDGTNFSSVAEGRVTISETSIGRQVADPFWMAVALMLLVCFVVMQFTKATGTHPLLMKGSLSAVLSGIVLFGLLLFTLRHLAFSQILRDTMTVGGDTPAHNYLASHLQDELFHHGRVISWAGGWWAGFPMFQFYFCLPYALMAALSLAIPFNIAFKLISILGLVALPLCAHGSARMLRLPKPVPVLWALAAVPFLFVRTHTMWGANIASTLAGMIANSISFPIMLLAVASAYRDVEDETFRLRTVLLFVALVASHFFTSVIAGLTIAFLPVLKGRRGFWSAARVLALEGSLAILLMAWWVLPLLAKSDYSMEFGTDWKLALLKTLPTYAIWLPPLVLLALALGWLRGFKAVWILVWMLGVSLFLFFFGSRLSSVFVNVRLWPFVFFAWLALAATGLGLFLERRRASGWALAALLVATLAYVERSESLPADPVCRPAGAARACAFWNYQGLEAKAYWPVFQELVLPLDHTPGRLANDLIEDNTLLGSSRIFEAVPHLIDKPVLEGGLVNSAIGSMFSYYIQGETSTNCAGFPTIVKPTTFNITNATSHLKLFNVKHFIAKWPVVQNALRRSPDWRFVRASHGWELYELLNHSGSYVYVPDARPAVVEMAKWKDWEACALEWIYTIKALDQPFIFVKPGAASLLPGGPPRLNESEFLRYLAGRRAGASTASHDAVVLPEPQHLLFGHHVRNEQVTDDRIVFDTDAIGHPHIIKCTYYPNWKVRGADGVYLVTPAFMLVYPKQEHVELYYGSTWSDALGRSLSLMGLGILGIVWYRRPTPRHLVNHLLSRVTLLKFLDATFGFTLCWALGYLRYFMKHESQTVPEVRPAAGQRILVVRPGGMGDMILLIPALQTLRRTFPHVTLTLVCERRNLEVLRMAGLAEQAVLYDAQPLRLLWLLLRRKFDVAIDSEQFHHFSALIALFSRAPVRVGFKINPGRNLLYTHLITYDLDGYESTQFMKLLAPLGITASDARVEGCLRGTVGPLPPALATRFAEQPLIIAYPGSTTRYKQWSPAKFGELLRRLGAKPEFTFALVGGRSDRAVSAAVARIACLPEGRLISLTGDRTLAETAAVMQRARLFIGGDSGLAHLALALGTPTVVLFGPSDHHKWGLVSEQHLIVRKDLACAPCFIFGYHKLCQTVACMAGISVNDVMSACARMLKET